jgi:hypothetical protein
MVSRDIISYLAVLSLSYNNIRKIPPKMIVKKNNTLM